MTNETINPLASENPVHVITDHRIKIGLIGAGGIAAAHVEAYRLNPDLVIFAAVADAVAENAHRRGDEFGATVYTDFETMLRQADIDAVDICLPHHLHKDAIVAAARAGKHILCEKPLCLTAGEAAELTAALEANAVTLMCAHNQLFMPAVVKAKQLLDEGVLGEIYEVHTTDSFFNDFNLESMGWRASAATSGGGELIDTGYHPTYLLLHLAGARPVEAVAMLSTHRLSFMEGEDTAQVLVRFENGALGTIGTSWAYDAPSNSDRFSVIGELGSIRGSDVGVSYRLRGSTEDLVFEFEPVNTFAAEIEHFARCLISGSRPIHTQSEGIDVLGIILAAYESARTKAIAPVLQAQDSFVD
jgi:predicted dehydrogenase